jgi:putative intracellular protease/amidase
MGNTDKKTGVWLSELTHPYYYLKDDKTHIDVVSITGGSIPIDPGSIEETDKYNDKFLNSEDTASILKNSQSLKEIDASQYDAIIFTGGHGTMWDFPHNDVIQAKISEINKKSGVIGAICHGVAALLGVKVQNGDMLIKGKKVTGFSNEEESAVNLTEIVPFSLEQELSRISNYQSKAAWSSHAISDKNIVTAQNPQSAEEFAKEIKSLLSAR